MTEPTPNLTPIGAPRQTSTVEVERMELPDGMVEAAAEAIHEADKRQGWAHGEWAACTPVSLAGYRDMARDVLSAALAGCEVQVQGRVRVETQPTDGSAPIVTRLPWRSLGDAEKDVAVWHVMYPGSSYSVERRTVITTSPAVVEGETEHG